MYDFGDDGDVVGEEEERPCGFWRRAWRSRIE